MESFAAVVPSSRTDVDMPCQGLLSMFFRQQANQSGVGSTTKRRLHQNPDASWASIAHHNMTKKI